MAADYIVVNRAKQLGNRLVRAAELVRETCDLVDSINDVGQHCFNGGDFSVFETQFGLVTGTGSNTLTLLGLVNTILNGTGEVTGANRRAQLDEFISRLAGQ